MIGSTSVRAASAPDWMHAQTAVAPPAHDDQTTAVLLYSEQMLSVSPEGRLRQRVRRVYRILRPDGASYGKLVVNYDSSHRVTDIHGWCIPASGKDYEVKEKEAVDTALPGILNGALLSDLRAKVIVIPAALPGNLVGYEYEQELPPYLLNDDWVSQGAVPSREAHYILRLPAGWTYSATWLNHAEVGPTESTSGGTRQWEWILSDLPAIAVEPSMPPLRGLSARMTVSLSDSGGRRSGWNSWQDLGTWYSQLAAHRDEASPEIRAKVGELTGSETSVPGKIQTLARFVQHDVRYVAVELGIGSYQPHAAAEVFAHRYGDCKDKVTLLSAMLNVVGVDSYPILANTIRGAVLPDSPVNIGFNHMILAIRLPPESDAPQFIATVEDPRLGRFLVFDPTDTFSPLGTLRGELQGSYGLLVSPGASNLIRLPQLPARTSGIRRIAAMTLDETGTLRGEITESWLGDAGVRQRTQLQATRFGAEQVRLVELRLGDSLSTFHVTSAAVANVDLLEQPVEWRYALEAPQYARITGDALLLRRWIVGSLSSGILETKEARREPIEFAGPVLDTDQVDIEIPRGYRVDAMPSPVNDERDFASYHSKTEIVQGKVRYSRSLEIKQLSVPVEKATELKELDREIYRDERTTVVLIKANP